MWGLPASGNGGVQQQQGSPGCTGRQRLRQSDRRHPHIPPHTLHLLWEASRGRAVCVRTRAVVFGAAVSIAEAPRGGSDGGGVTPWREELAPMGLNGTEICRWKRPRGGVQEWFDHGLHSLLCGSPRNSVCVYIDRQVSLWELNKCLPPIGGIRARESCPPFSDHLTEALIGPLDGMVSLNQFLNPPCSGPRPQLGPRRQETLLGQMLGGWEPGRWCSGPWGPLGGDCAAFPFPHSSDP